VRHEDFLEVKIECLADLMARQTLRIEQVVAVAADIAKQVALMHRQGLVYGALESRNVRLTAGRASLVPRAPAETARVADDVRAFGVWLQELLGALPPTEDWRRMELHEIADRYLQPELLPVSSQMKKAAMALSLLRVTSLGATDLAVTPAEAITEALTPEVIAPDVALGQAMLPGPSDENRRKGNVLLLLRTVSPEEVDEARQAGEKAQAYRVPWLAATAILICILAALYFFLKEIL
jgi:hypothetical protein